VEAPHLPHEHRLRSNGGANLTRVLDCCCYCVKCVSRTQETYRLRGTCPNCEEAFTAVIRKGDRRPTMVDCPACGVYAVPCWGGLVEEPERSSF
jgi:hypothetical protein